LAEYRHPPGCGPFSFSLPCLPLAAWLVAGNRGSWLAMPARLFTLLRPSRLDSHHTSEKAFIPPAAVGEYALISLRRESNNTQRIHHRSIATVLRYRVMKPARCLIFSIMAESFDDCDLILGPLSPRPSVWSRPPSIVAVRDAYRANAWHVWIYGGGR
jgi:hypothetical protein